MGSIRKVILVTGDREWVDRKIIEMLMVKENETTLFLHGGARGADSCTDEAARAIGRPRASIPYFGNFGRAGGPIRNSFMLDVILGLKAQGYITEVWGFHDDLANSKGTKDMMTKAKGSGLKVRHFAHK